jgi:hypothetical protein
MREAESYFTQQMDRAMGKEVTASSLRKRVLEDHAENVIDCFIRRATGGRAVMGADVRALEKAFDRIMNLVEQASDPISGIDLMNKTTAQRIDEILAKVADGTITPSEGKAAMAMISSGFEITELAELIARLDNIEKTTK